MSPARKPLNSPARAWTPLGACMAWWCWSLRPSPRVGVQWLPLMTASASGTRSDTPARAVQLTRQSSSARESVKATQMRASSSTPELLRPMAAASMSRLRDLLVSGPWVAVRLHGERCRPCLICTLCGRALCNGRHELHSPPQSYHEPKRPVSEMLMIFGKHWLRRIENPYNAGLEL